ncbi:MAG: hypothetical protein WCJ95_18705, partial [Mariniphaga sp.]
MANSNEIVEFEKITKAVISMDASLIGLSKTYLTLVKNMGDVTEKAKEHTLTVDSLTKAQKDAAEAQKQLDSANKALAQSEAKLNSFDAVMYEQILKNNKALADKKKEIADNVKAEGLAETSLVRMRQKLSELTAAYDKSGTRTKAAAEEINKLSREIGKAEEATNRGQRNVGQYGSIWEKVTGVFAGVMGAIAAAAGAIKFAHSVIESSEELSDKFKVTTTGLNAAWGAFLNTIATGDWSHLIDNITNANKLGREYAEVLELLEKRQRGNSIAVIEAKEEAARLKVSLSEGNKTYAEKVAIMSQVIEIEKGAGENTAKLAKDSKDKLYEEISGIKKVDQAELERFIHFKEGSVEQFQLVKDYNEAMEKRASVSASTAVAEAQGLNVEKGKASIEKYNQSILNASESTKQWAAIMSKLSPEEIESLTAATKATSEANAEVYTNILKDSKRLGMFKKTLSAEEEAAAAEEIKAREAKQKRFADMDNEASKILDDNEKKKKVSASKELKRQQDLSKDIEQTVDDQLAAQAKSEEDMIQDSIKLGEKALEEKKKLKDKEVEAEKEKAKKIRDAEIELAKAAGDAIFEMQNMKLEKELGQLQIERDAKLKNENLTADQKAKIEADFTKKSNALRTKQAENDKKQALFDIILGTAVSIINQKGKIPLMIMMAAMGAIEA